MQGLPSVAVLDSFYSVILYSWGAFGYNYRDGHLNGEPGTKAIRRQRASHTGTGVGDERWTGTDAVPILVVEVL